MPRGVVSAKGASEISSETSLDYLNTALPPHEARDRMFNHHVTE